MKRTDDRKETAPDQRVTSDRPEDAAHLSTHARGLALARRAFRDYAATFRALATR